MKFFFAKTSIKDIISAINQELAGRKLGDMVSLEEEGGKLVVKISKGGTSKLVFATAADAGGMKLEKSEEKIALTHRLFKDEVTRKFVQVVEKAGGQVTA